jgi:hypothetical protein
MSTAYAREDHLGADECQGIEMPKADNCFLYRRER